MTTTLLLIRHGQTDWNAAGRWQGHTDIPLNRTGVAQAHALADRLHRWPIQAIYSSDLQRAAATAHILGQRNGISVNLDPCWRERFAGRLEGLTREQIQEQLPEVWAVLAQGQAEAPEGESYAALRERVAAAYQNLLRQHPDQMIAIVSHGGTLHNFISYVMGFPPHHSASFSLRGNTGLSIVQADSHRAYLLLLNDTSHLEHDEQLGSMFHFITQT
ncbi:MAG: phosphoglycerate mutase family protein [Anaerolineae bacterium]|nr:phosphoglycerate mutase family protein [Anaerolineae bacterium]